MTDEEGFPKNKKTKSPFRYKKVGKNKYEYDFMSWDEWEDMMGENKMKEDGMTKYEKFLELMKEIVEGWEEVRTYDDDHLYYDRTKWINKGIDEEWWEFPDEYDRDTDVQTLCLLIEQYLRYSNIVKETKIGMLPKVDGIDDEDTRIVGSEKHTITELEPDRKKKILLKRITNYLLKK